MNPVDRSVHRILRFQIKEFNPLMNSHLISTNIDFTASINKVIRDYTNAVFEDVTSSYKDD